MTIMLCLGTQCQFFLGVCKETKRDDREGLHRSLPSATNLSQNVSAYTLGRLQENFVQILWQIPCDQYSLCS